MALTALLLWGAAGCADRAIGLSVCEDGELDPGEVCLDDPGDVRRADFEPLAMQVADFDGDAHLDVLMLGVEEWTVRSILLPGDGTGELGTGRDSNLFGCSAYPIPGDIDGDEAADLLVSECGPSMLVFSGGADGFVDARSVATGGVARTSSIVDVDQDGRSDIVVLATDDAGLATMNVALRETDGRFAAPAISAVSAVLPGFDPYGFGLGDLDEDGTLDALLVDTSEAGGSAAVARGRGDGRFEAAEAVASDVALASAWLRDFDDDGHLDVLARDRATSDLVLLAGDGVGGFSPSARTTRDDPDPLASATLADLDGDGSDDLLFGLQGDSVVEVWLGGGDGTFEKPQQIDVGDEARQIAIGDFDEDGAPDLVVGTFAAGGIRVILARP